MKEEKRIKKEVKKLAKEKKYNEIYEQYGTKWFRKYVSHQYKKEDIKKLEKEGKFFDIYHRYGEEELDYSEIYKRDIEMETGKKPNLFQRIKEYRRKGIEFFKIALLTLGFDSTILIGYTATSSDIEKFNNGITYKKEIKEYDEKIEKYANEVKEMNLNDIEIIMKVTNDMWENIYAYGNPQMDVHGYLCLDMQEDGIGVCRNMADDIANKLNKINPDYNARFISGYFDYSNLEPNTIQSRIIEPGQYLKVDKGNKKVIYFNGKKREEIINGENKTFKISYNQNEDIDYVIITSEEKIREIHYNNNKINYTIDIDIKSREKELSIYNEDGKVIDRINKEYNEESVNTENNNIGDIIKNSIKGNHAVVAIDIKEDNVTLILDPNNKAIGYYDNGKIIMFNERNKEEGKFKRTFFTDIVFNGLESIISYPTDYATSFFNTDLTYEELEEKYGVEAQNRTLKELEKNHKISFKNSLKVEEMSKEIINDTENKMPNIEIDINDLNR